MLAGLLFGVMGVCVKFASEHFTAMELVFYRSALGCALAFAVARLWRRTLPTQNFRAHCARAAAGFTSLFLFFYALPKLHLSTSMALLQTSPLFFALMVAVFMRERPSTALLCALVVSFCGMLLVLRPDMDREQLVAGAAAAGSGAAAGCAYFNIRRLGILNEGGIRTVFYFTAISTVLSGLILAAGGQMSPISSTGAMWLIAIGITATAGQFTLTRGLHYGESFSASALMYSSVIFAGALDYAVWGNALGLLSWCGIALIVGGGVGAVWHNAAHSRRLRKQLQT